jgi:sulfide dehydrogenase [flavocytochrome c] flavoprotein subunit
MTHKNHTSRREFLRAAAAATASLALASPSLAQSPARVVVIGGGFGGASCARALRQLDPSLDVTLVTADRQYVACPFSNEVIAGDRAIEAQQFTYEKTAAAGIKVVVQMAQTIDPQARTIGLADGSTLRYDRLVLSPGIDLRFDALAGL